MRVTTIVYTILLAVGSIEAAAIASPTPEALAEASKLKRTAEAIAEALAEPIALAEPQSRFCYRSGGACSKAKREALALAEAIAEAHATADPAAAIHQGHNSCHRAGEVCNNLKREAIASAEALAVAEASAFPDADAEADASAFCYRDGQSCQKLKRATEAIAEAITEPSPTPESEITKRGLDNISKMVERSAAIHRGHNTCHGAGEGCNTL